VKPSGTLPRNIDVSNIFCGLVSRPGAFTMRSDIPAAIAALLPFPLFSPSADMKSSMNIVGTAESAGQLTSFIAALTAADMVDTLKGTGPFTVFAPTDAAFAKLPAGALENLLKPENKKKLTGILKYHVVAGKVKAAAVMTMSSAQTLNGQAVTLSLHGNTVKIDDSTVVKADIAASNGIIHIMDAVLLPN
jgi:transforming growth factor-beta-induced protein